MCHKPHDFIGKIVISRFPYFDVKTKSQKFKGRPMLVIGIEKEIFPCDFNVLPISKVSKQKHVSEDYDVALNNSQCEALSLNHSPSYVRVHKQSIVNSRDVQSGSISDLKNTLPEVYDEIKNKHILFNEDLF